MVDPFNVETTNVLPLIMVLNRILLAPMELAIKDDVVIVFPDMVEN